MIIQKIVFYMANKNIFFTHCIAIMQCFSILSNNNARNSSLVDENQFSNPTATI